MTRPSKNYIHHAGGDMLEAATARADALSWQPIDTVPRDGSWILLTDGCRVEPAYWGDSYFNFDQAFIQYGYRSDFEYPDLNTPYTHWMPLPAPPEQKP